VRGVRSNGARAVDYNYTEADADAESIFDARTCDSCKWPNASESFLLCDECNTGYHTYCLQPALSSVPQGQWVCPPCSNRFFKIDGSSPDDYHAWLDRHSLVAVLGKSGTYRPVSARAMRGVFILPTPVQFDASCDDLHRQDLVAPEHRWQRGRHRERK
jgi:hypothetical protein